MKSGHFQILSRLRAGRSLALILAMLSLSGAQALLAQGGTALIRGTVSDSTGGSVPDADVSVRHAGTGVLWTAKSDTDGRFALPQLPIGTWDIAVRKPGFKSFAHTGIVLQAAQRLTFDVTMQVGELQQVVDVTGDVTQVETQSGTLRQVIDSKRMTDLPLNGRNALQLLSLVPGVTPMAGGAQNQSTTMASTFVSVNGSRVNKTNFQLDGVDNNDPYTQVANPFPSPDALAEFSVQTNGFDAEFGKSSGATVNAVTRSGTNQVHGSAFNFLRNGAVNARNFFAIEPDALKRNQFGATLGGPVFIPRVYNGRDKTFFFFSYQGTRNTDRPSSLFALTPTAEQRQGDFSRLSRNLVDPLTRQPFPGNRIPSSRLDPLILRYTNDWLPLPNAPNNNFRYALRAVSNEDQYLVRIDENLTSAHRLSFRYFYFNTITPPYWQPNASVVARQGFSGIGHNAEITHTWTVRPSLLTTFSFGYNRLNTTPPLPERYPVTADYNIRVTTQPPDPLSMSVTNYFAANLAPPVLNKRNTFHWDNTTTYQRGGHLIKWGGSARRIRLKWDWNSMFPAFTFNGFETTDALADYFLGRASNFGISTPRGMDNRFTAWGFFFQDNWRVNRRVSLNLGFRYDPYFPPHYAHINKILQFRPADVLAGNRSQVFTNAPPGTFYYGDPGVSKSGMKRDLRTLAPRAGLAIDLTGKSQTVLRMAYGLFFDEPQIILWNRFQIAQPWARTIAIPAPPSVAAPYGGGQDPLIGFNRNVRPPRDFPFLSPANGVTTFAEDTRVPYVQQWNFTLEHAVSSFVVRAGYVGTKGTRLQWAREDNLPIYIPGASTIGNLNSRRPFAPHYAAVGRMYFDSNSVYHSLQTALERRLRSGFTISANYTFSRAIDFNSNDGEGQNGPPSPANRRLERGLFNGDVPHRLVASAVYELPKLRSGFRALNFAAGGWQISGILAITPKGTPFTVVPGIDAMLTGDGLQRADLVSLNTSLPDRTKSEWIAKAFNTSAFAVAAPGRVGTAGRNILRSPGSLTNDIAISKEFPIREEFRVQFRSEFFNLANRANFGAPNAAVSSPLFGRITSAGTPRILQFALRIAF